MELLQQFWAMFTDLNGTLNGWAAMVGPGLYGILFAIVFCETGLVVTPFLPGDSLLFAVGALAAGTLPNGDPSPLNVGAVIGLLIVAGVIGDAVNYAIGRKIGPKVFNRPSSRWLKQEHLQRTHEFYERHGGKAIIFARFIPIIRTFAPFVAGIGSMSYRKFAAYNVIGAVLWVTGFTLAGYYFGNLPAVKKNFQYVILAIIVLSVLPAVIEVLKARKASRGPASGAVPAPSPAE